MKQTDVTFGRGVIVVVGLGLATAVPVFAEQRRVSLVWEVIAWSIIALIGMTLWHYRAVRRRPALFYSFLGIVIFLAILGTLGHFMPDGP